MNYSSKDQSDDAKDERIAKLRALRSTMSRGNTPARTREELDRMLRDRVSARSAADTADDDHTSLVNIEAVAVTTATQNDDQVDDATTADLDDADVPLAEPRVGVEHHDGLAAAFRDAKIGEDFDDASEEDDIETDFTKNEEWPAEQLDSGTEDAFLDPAPSSPDVEATWQDGEPEAPQEVLTPEPETEPNPGPTRKPAFDAAALISQLKKRAAPTAEKAEPKPAPQSTASVVSQTIARANADTEFQAEASEPDLPMPEPDLSAEVAPDAEPVQTPVVESTEFSGFEPEPEDEVFEQPETAFLAEPEPLPEPAKVEGPVSIPDFDADDAPAEPDLTARPERARKTRLLGFDQDGERIDPFATTGAAAATQGMRFPVGWLVIVEGAGQGEAFALGAGAAVIGRGEGQAIRLDFGDTSISRENHAAIAYDDETNGFILAQGGKANLVRLNGRPVLSNEALSHGDFIRIGKTKLRFVALCDENFAWQSESQGGIE